MTSIAADIRRCNKYENNNLYNRTTTSSNDQQLYKFRFTHIDNYHSLILTIMAGATKLFRVHERFLACGDEPFPNKVRSLSAHDERVRPLPKLSIVYRDKTDTLALLGTRHTGRSLESRIKSVRSTFDNCVKDFTVEVYVFCYLIHIINIVRGFRNVAIIFST
ncbi:hypothetical protein ALC62_01623 [Cyphomyrmex costatus]|uniref:Uncharacterized protein n=1 Tax=Cyphomyrmex costatus TaxID=456900 RepID=A0A195D3I8_9HYME|nr:hypothetical protein ALC62_01623 [Cyphomyrmex costatus]